MTWWKTTPSYEEKFFDEAFPKLPSLKPFNVAVDPPSDDPDATVATTYQISRKTVWTVDDSILGDAGGLSDAIRDMTMKLAIDASRRHEKAIVETCFLRDETTHPNTITLETILDMIETTQASIEHIEVPIYVRAIELGLEIVIMKHSDSPLGWPENEAIHSPLHQGPYLIGRVLYVPPSKRHYVEKARQIIAIRTAADD